MLCLALIKIRSCCHHHKQTLLLGSGTRYQRLSKIMVLLNLFSIQNHYFRQQRKTLSTAFRNIDIIDINLQKTLSLFLVSDALMIPGLEFQVRCHSFIPSFSCLLNYKTNKQTNIFKSYYVLISDSHRPGNNNNSKLYVVLTICAEVKV